MANFTKLYTRAHEFITVPDVHGIAYMGLSDYALNYLWRIYNLNVSKNPKVMYSIYNNSQILDFLKYKPSELSLSQRLFQDRFWIKQHQPIAIFQSVEFDVEYTAPVDLRVLEINDKVSRDWRITLLESWILRVQVLSPEQIGQLLSEEQYNKLPKYMQYC